MVKKHLVTTALEETWPNQKSKIIFLGEWCKLYSKKKSWKNLSYEVLDYHWDNRNKFEKDYYYLIEPGYYYYIKNILCFQGFKIANVYNGWCIEHDTGFITHVSFYEDDIPIKGFQFIKSPKSLFMFAINAANCNKGIVRYMKNDEINNIIKFMNNVFEKLSKPNNLSEFLSDKNNLEMLDTVSYMYIKDANLKTFDENISYLIGNEKTLIEEYKNLKEKLYKLKKEQSILSDINIQETLQKYKDDPSYAPLEWINERNF